MYTSKNFRTKKEFKQAVEAWNAVVADGKSHEHYPIGVRPVTYFQPGPFGGNEPRDGTIYIEGPHFPAQHRFYAQCIAKDGVIIKVK